MKTYRLYKKGVEKENYYSPNIIITHDEFTSLVESSDWLIWDELTVRGIEDYKKYPSLRLKTTAYVNLEDLMFISIEYTGLNYCMVTFENKISYKILKLIFEFAEKLKCNLWDRDTLEIVNDSSLEAFRIKEENRGIKLTKEQSHVLESLDDQCRWFYIPTDDVDAVLKILNIQPKIQEGDITTIIDDAQRENKVVIATFTGHTIIFGCNAPYISYPDLKSFLAKEEQQSALLKDVLNNLSKTFGTAAYFEYNNDDELIASLAWSSKGKFVYGRFTSEGEGFDIFGTQKKPMEVNQMSIIKTAKKLGMTPEDILIGIMKQKMPVRYFTQPHWYIESRLTNRK